MLLWKALGRYIVNQDSVKHGQMFVKHVLPAAVKPVHSLWHEIIGFIFVIFALAAALSAYRTYRSFTGDMGDLVRMIFCGIFFLFMAAYGISSFRKARKISRS